VTAYTCTKFGVDSSSRFPFGVQSNRQTNRHTRLNDIPMLAAMPACVTKANMPWKQNILQHKINTKTKARFGHLLRPPTWKWNGSILEE